MVNCVNSKWVREGGSTYSKLFDPAALAWFPIDGNLSDESNVTPIFLTV